MAIMFKNHVDRKVERVEKNLPLIAALPAAEVRRIVKEAIGVTKGPRITIGIIGAVVGAGSGLMLAPHYLDSPYPRFAYSAVAAACALVATYAATEIGEQLLNRKIEAIAQDPQ